MNSVPGVEGVTSHTASVTFAMIAPAPSVATTSSCSGGSSGHGDDASDAMNDVGGADSNTKARLVVTSRSGGDDTTWPHATHSTRTYTCALGGACSVTVTDIGVDAALPLISSGTVHGSATSCALRTLAFTSTTSHAALMPAASSTGVPVVALKWSSIGLYPSTCVTGATHSRPTCSVEVASVGSRTRSPVGVQVHSAATTSGVDSGQVVVGSAGRLTTMLALSAATAIRDAVVDANGDLAAIRVVSGVVSGRLVAAVNRPATHDTSVLASTPGRGVDGTTTAGIAAADAAPQSARSTATLTLIGAPSAALRPTPSRHVSINDALVPPAARNPTANIDTLARVAVADNEIDTDVSPTSCAVVAPASPCPTPGAAAAAAGWIDDATDTLHVSTLRAGAATSTAGAHGSTACAPDGHTARADAAAPPLRGTTV